MTLATDCRMTFEEYLDYDDDTDMRYELVDGVLVEMGAENDINIEIAGFLVSILLQFFPHYLIRRGTEVEVNSPVATSRYPDLMVLTETTREAMKQDKRSIVLRSMPAPALVVEVVSPGDEHSTNYKRDYEEKPLEYAARGIPEYWIVDPERAIISIGVLMENAYQFTQYQGDKAISSPIFPAFNLTAAQILTAGL
jgi:Uma2 family endonuclease